MVVQIFTVFCIRVLGRAGGATDGGASVGGIASSSADKPQPLRLGPCRYVCTSLSNGLSLRHLARSAFTLMSAVFLELYFLHIGQGLYNPPRRTDPMSTSCTPLRTVASVESPKNARLLRRGLFAIASRRTVHVLSKTTHGGGVEGGVRGFEI